MIDVITNKKFEATTATLSGSNLIEASAGTGKTYSIAILVLRLILEQRLSVRQILMVTFTKAAVAELEERIRLFVRQAYQVSLGHPVKDENIMNVVLEVINPNDPGPVQQQLRDALLLLDETAVLTIHSFCQQTLNEFAVETNQLFGAAMLPDLTPTVEDELNKYWRKYVTTLKTELLQRIWYEGMRTTIQQILLQHLGGKKYIGFNEASLYAIEDAQQDIWIQTLTALESEEQQATTSLYSYIAANAVKLKAACEANCYTSKWNTLIAAPPDLIEKIKNKKEKAKYVADVFPEILCQLEDLDKISDKKQELLQAIRQQLYFIAIQEVSIGLRHFKARSNMLGYDDLISNLHSALVKSDNPELIKALQQKYKAVFVDEFQDTDRLQFEIFDKAFGQNTILYYIGDPKQSIYAWRKADIFTYFNARKGVQHLYGMNYNFRSSENMIAAMNSFFKPAPHFDTFYFSGEKDSIAYIHVESLPGNNKGFLYKGADKEVPITVFTYDKKEKISEAVAAQLYRLLQDADYRIVNDTGAREITPADIGILVRTGKEGKSIKQALARLGIPAVTIDESKVLQTPEAQQVLYLLKAMETPDRSAINRALLSSFTGFDTQSILQLDDAVTLTLFNKYRECWQQDGAYTALMEFITDFNVRNILLDNYSENGERIITNLYQLAELVHQVQSRKNFSMRDLISWLKRGIDGMAADGDEYEQRIESDEEAVNIVTIHRSKGLEYKIVMAPFLDFVENKKVTFVSFRNPDTGDYISAEKKYLTEKQLLAYQQQLEQENRRLIYVAITRAVYKCYVFRNSYNKKSSLSTFLDVLKDQVPDPSLIQLHATLPEKPGQRYRQPVLLPVSPVNTRPVSFHLKEENWRKLSYTMLAAKSDLWLPLQVFQPEDLYDNFIFKTLRRGAKSGNLLHFIFENINFSDNNKWEHWLEEAIRHFAPGQRELYLTRLYEMLQHVLHANIEIAGDKFQLAAIGRNKRLAELEFDFPVPVFETNQLNSLSNELVTINIKRFSEYSSQELEGIMNGKIDLFFEHNDKYYILDWKSTYLGNRVTDYAPAALAVAMNEYNYHLQYLIYTIAVKKYLESRIPGFNYASQFGGVIYCFVRGMRSNSTYGIFTAKPDMEKILLVEKVLTT